MATPQTRFQPMMARAPMAFHASPVSAAQLPVYTRPAVRGVKRIFAKCYSTFNKEKAFSRHCEIFAKKCLESLPVRTYVSLQAS